MQRSTYTPAVYSTERCETSVVNEVEHTCTQRLDVVTGAATDTLQTQDVVVLLVHGLIPLLCTQQKHLCKQSHVLTNYINMCTLMCCLICC